MKLETTRQYNDLLVADAGDAGGGGRGRVRPQELEVLGVRSRQPEPGQPLQASADPLGAQALRLHLLLQVLCRRQQSEPSRADTARQRIVSSLNINRTNLSFLIHV